MNVKTIEKLLSPGSSRYRPAIWKMVARYAIEPELEIFRTKDISERASTRELIVSPSNVNNELKVLGINGMVVGQPSPVPHDSRFLYARYDPWSLWYSRADQEAWDIAVSALTEVLGSPS